MDMRSIVQFSLRTPRRYYLCFLITVAILVCSAELTSAQEKVPGKATPTPTPAIIAPPDDAPLKVQTLEKHSKITSSLHLLSVDPME